MKIIKNHKIALVVLAAIIIVAVILKIVSLSQRSQIRVDENNIPIPESTVDIIDNHGCLISGGYAWCEDTQKCLKVGEEECIAPENIPEVRLDNIDAGSLVLSPQLIRGEARGAWFFEGTMPLLVLDSEEKLIYSTVATAQGDWQSESLVPFEAQLEFTTTALSGYLVFKKDNPSDLPENGAELRIPVNFK